MDPRSPTFAEAVRFWLKLGFISFGGPAGQIAVMHTELVERKKWIGEERFLHALNFCMLLPGPEATQLATYCGWMLHRTWGGIVAGVLFVLPSALLLWGLSWMYVVLGDVPWIAAAFHGLKPAVTAIVVAAVIRIGRRALKNSTSWALASGAFVAIFFFRLPFPMIVCGAAILGWLGTRWRKASSAEIKAVPAVETPAPSWQRATTVVAVSLLLWWAPVLAAGVWRGWDGVLVREGVFFSKAAMVTFGGAYAVLPYVGQQAVEVHGWLSAAQMLDGLGLAETTPGPLIMVVQFVGFLGGWNQAGALSPIMMATLGAAMTTWTTFVPCFLWILLGAPYIERLHNHTRLSAALAAVTAAVVGVILNLAIWFGLQVFFPEGIGAGRVDWFAMAVCVVAFLALQRWKIDVVPVVFASALAGVVWSVLSA